MRRPGTRPGPARRRPTWRNEATVLGGARRAELNRAAVERLAIGKLLVRHARERRHTTGLVPRLARRCQPDAPAGASCPGRDSPESLDELTDGLVVLIRLVLVAGVPRPGQDSEPRVRNCRRELDCRAGRNDRV